MFVLPPELVFNTWAMRPLLQLTSSLLWTRGQVRLTIKWLERQLNEHRGTIIRPPNIPKFSARVQIRLRNANIPIYIGDQ